MPCTPRRRPGLQLVEAREVELLGLRGSLHLSENVLSFSFPCCENGSNILKMATFWNDTKIIAKRSTKTEHCCSR